MIEQDSTSSGVYLLDGEHVVELFEIYRIRIFSITGMARQERVVQTHQLERGHCGKAYEGERRYHAKECPNPGRKSLLLPIGQVQVLRVKVEVFYFHASSFQPFLFVHFYFL